MGMDYTIFMMSSMIIFNFMRQGTESALPSLVSNHDMLEKTKVSFHIFPTANVLSALVSFGFAFISLVIVMLIRVPAGFDFHNENPFIGSSDALAYNVYSGTFLYLVGIVCFL